MSSDNLTNPLYKGVGVMRDEFTLARQFFDIAVYEDGFAGFVVWKRNTYRIPLISHIRDYRKRSKRLSMNRTDAVQADERNFFFAYDDIQGIVSDERHKEFQVLSNSEQLTVIFRSYDDYNEFLGLLKKNIKSKVFDRDADKISESIAI